MSRKAAATAQLFSQCVMCAAIRTCATTASDVTADSNSAFVALSSSARANASRASLRTLSQSLIRCGASATRETGTGTTMGRASLAGGRTGNLFFFATRAQPQIPAAVQEDDQERDEHDR